MQEQYKFAHAPGTGEIIEKKSRFIATVAPVKTEEDALKFIEQCKKKYWDASHNCTAFTLGRLHQLTRCSDDGEPAGTAGRPMLDVLLGEDIHDTAVVVTRYFGGTLLGTGGLVRAYSKAVQEGLRQAVILDKHRGKHLSIRTDYNDFGKVQYLLGQNRIPILHSDYADTVSLKVLVPYAFLANLTADITDGTGGRAVLEPGDVCWYAVSDNEILLFEEEES